MTTFKFVGDSSFLLGNQVKVLEAIHDSLVIKIRIETIDRYNSRIKYWVSLFSSI